MTKIQGAWYTVLVDIVETRSSGNLRWAEIGSADKSYDEFVVTLREIFAKFSIGFGYNYRPPTDLELMEIKNMHSDLKEKQYVDSGSLLENIA